jgi:predicted aspartyl protease
MAKITLTNLFDIQAVREGRLAPARARVVTLEALVDTGATMLVIPGSAAAALGLPEVRRTRCRYADGRPGWVAIVAGIDLLLPELGRGMTAEAIVEPDGHCALIGQVPLEVMDLVVDPKSRELRVNPASPDIPMLDMFAVA